MQDKDLYIIAELSYKKEHQGENNIFPKDWYSTKNYQLKTEIIAEAIKKKTRIDKTELYQKKMLEKIRNYH